MKALPYAGQAHGWKSAYLPASLAAQHGGLGGSA